MIRRLVLVAFIVAGVGIGLLAWIEWRYASYIAPDLASLSERPVAIVFGAGIRADGGLTPMLADRVDTAIRLYQAGKVRKLLMSGDNRFIDYDEPSAMYNYAVAHGVPPEDVVRDFAGRRTYDTCYRSSAIFGVRQAILVTQRYHLTRSLYTCRNLGVDATGIAADSHDYRTNTFYRMRDALATLRAIWDVKIARPLPVLGEPIDIGL